MTEVAEKKSSVTILPFGIVIDEPRNGDVLLQSIPGARLRSRISATKPVKDSKTGKMLIPPDQAAYLGQFPEMPGMELHVNPEKLTYSIVDPLADDEERCDAIRLAMEQVGPFRSKGKLKGVETQRGKLDVHRMKTLVREMYGLVQNDMAKVVKGSMPEFDLISQMPGNFLMNPGAKISNTQPNFERDWSGWLERLTAAGG